MPPRIKKTVQVSPSQAYPTPQRSARSSTKGANTPSSIIPDSEDEEEAGGFLAESSEDEMALKPSPAGKRKAVTAKRPPAKRRATLEVSVTARKTPTNPITPTSDGSESEGEAIVRRLQSQFADTEAATKNDPGRSQAELEALGPVHIGRSKVKKATAAKPPKRAKAPVNLKMDTDYASDSDAEAEMLKAALAMSKEGSDTPVSSVAESSSKAKPKPRNSMASKAAKAAERRIKLETRGSDSEPSDLALPSDSDAESELSAEFSEADDIDQLTGEDNIAESIANAKGKGKRKGRGSGAAAAKRARDSKDPVKMLEYELKDKVKRKLYQQEKNLCALTVHHPEIVNVWGDLENKITPVKPVPMEAHPSLKLTLLPFQKESLFWMKKQEEGPWKGGMLADEMGMGKTIQTIALLLSEPRQKPSLVVAPVVALMQWKHEIETHAEGFTTLLYHGSSKVSAEQLKKVDVVLTSYGTLEASFRRQHSGFKRGNNIIKETSALHSIKWFRIILDEAHNIKERATNAAKAAFALEASYKWCLSGTPLQNRVGELYSLVRFLGADPFSYYFCKKCPCKDLHWKFSDRRSCDKCGHSPMHHVCLWNTEILSPIQKYGITAEGPGALAFKKLKILLDRMMLRRTKLERADDLGLPPRTIIVRKDYFSPAEKELYMSLFSTAKRQFSTYVGAGTVLNNYSNIFSLITRMRQMSCHPDLVLRSKTSTYIEQHQEEVVCRLCNDAAEDAIAAQCKHVFDRDCIKQYLETAAFQGKAPECPVCHVGISIDLEAEAIEISEDSKKARQGILGRLDLENWRSSSKLEALVEELTKLRDQDCTIKSLVFSQFVSFLDLISFRLQRAGFNVCRLEGGMTPQQRDATIQHFMNNTHVTVFLISLKAGGVALNLTEASRVFMMDSWWNPSVEYQAMDRIHRLGQRRPVTVTKIVIEDSIEQQIVQLQDKKLAMTEAALSHESDAALGKLTVEDLGFLFRM